MGKNVARIKLEEFGPGVQENVIRCMRRKIMQFWLQPDAPEQLEAFKQKLIARGEWPIEGYRDEAEKKTEE